MQAQMVVQSLQGTRAQILFAFLFAGHAMDVSELMTWTGRDRKTHYGHLDALCAIGLLARQTQAHGRDVFLLGSEMLPALNGWAEQIGNGVRELPDFQMSEKRTSGNAVVIIDPLSKIESSVNNNNKGQVSEKRTSAEMKALLEALARHRIVGKKKTELVCCEWVSAEYVLAHVEFSKSEGRGKYAVGMAITRMLDEVDQPGRRENGHIENCECEQCVGVVSLSKYKDLSIESSCDDDMEWTCIWQDDIVGTNLKTGFCGKAVRDGSHRWCEDHYIDDE
jgi:predicted transcriptional regulator